jgi:hypothetical protein
MSVAAAAPRGCSRCESPIEDGDLRCSVCALPVPIAPTTIERVHVQILRCTECGAAIAFDANKQAPACGFCTAVMKVEQPVDPVEAAMQRVPFTVDRELATAALRAWLGKRGYFAPKTLRDEAVFESLNPLCWAAWIVNATAQVSWSADSDAGSHRSAWAPHSGTVQLEFGNIAIPASRGLSASECSLLVPYYDLAKVVGVSESVEGETPAQVESFDAQRSAARQQVARAIEAVAKSRVEEHIPGHRTRNVNVSCLLESQSTDRVALPAWVLAYRYRGSPYRAIVHGQRPEIVFGTSPKDWAKVAMVAVLAIAGILAILLLVALISGR